MEDSEPAEDGLLAGLRWNRSARDQAQLKHKIRDLPGLLKHGLHLRKKSVSVETCLSVCPCSPCDDLSSLQSARGCFITPSRLRCFHFDTSVTVAVRVCVCVCVCARALYIHNNQLLLDIIPSHSGSQGNTTTPQHTHTHTHTRAHRNTHTANRHVYVHVSTQCAATKLPVILIIED